MSNSKNQPLNIYKTDHAMTQPSRYIRVCVVYCITYQLLIHSGRARMSGLTMPRNPKVVVFVDGKRLTLRRGSLVLQRTSVLLQKDYNAFRASVCNKFPCSLCVCEYDMYANGVCIPCGLSQPEYLQLLLGTMEDNIIEVNMVPPITKKKTA